MKVYQAINAVQAALSHEGISKSRRNLQQGYNYRGIDDVYNALAPLLAEHGLCILPRILSRAMEERQTARGGVLFYVTVEAEFDFVAAEDGSKHTIRTYGEAMDSADKATNKAMSAAYKYAAFMVFAIPTEIDSDADATSHEVAPRSPTVSLIAQLRSEAARVKKLGGNVGHLTAERVAAMGELDLEAAIHELREQAAELAERVPEVPPRVVGVGRS